MTQLGIESQYPVLLLSAYSTHRLNQTNMAELTATKWKCA